MKYKLLFCSLFSILSLEAIAANNDSIKKDTNSDGSKSFFNSDIFSLSKRKENAFDAPSAVYVLSSEDIRRSGVTSIPEALRLVPGIEVARIDGNKWAITARGFNHQFSSKLLILIDGLIVYTPVFSGEFWDNQDYIIEDIEKIEVIRGPGGSIWGANAVNGIINIITKSAAESQGSYLAQTIGNNAKSITEARFGGKTSILDSYRVYAKHAVRGGFKKLNDGSSNNDGTTNNNGSGSNHDGIVSDRAGFKYDIMSIKNNSLSLHGDVYKSTSNSYFSSPITDGRQDKEANSGNIVLNWSKTISSKSSFTLQTYFNYTNTFLPSLQIIEKTSDIDFQHFYSFSPRNQFTYGLGFKNLQDRFGTHTTNNDTAAFYPISYNPSTRNINVYSAFIQDKIGITNDFFFTIGSKFEVNEQTGFEYQPNIRLTYYPSRNQTLWSAVSRAIRVPTRGEDSVSIRIDPTTVVTQGNQRAKAEDVISYELGYRIKPTQKTSFDIASFFNKYSKLGTFDSTPDGTPTATNNGYATTYGFEVAAKWQALDNLKFEASYDFLKMDVRLNQYSNENQPLNGLNVDKLTYFQDASPKNKFRFRSLLNITPKIEFDNMVFYVDSLPAKTNIEKGVKSYVRWDTRFGYIFSQKFDMSVGIQNILDDRHQEFSAGLFNHKVEVGRTYYLKAVLQF